jgi:hypothetical protein
MAQVVSRWTVTAEARVRTRVSPCAICGGQTGTGTGSSSIYSDFPCQYHSTASPRSHTPAWPQFRDIFSPHRHDHEQVYCTGMQSDISIQWSVQSITLAARSKAYVCGRLVAGIAGSNPARDMDVCLLCICVVLSCVGRGLCDGLITRPEESYRVSVCVITETPKGALCSSWEPTGK